MKEVLIIFFKELLYAGIGFATMTKEKAEEVVTELIKKGELSADEGKDVLNSVLDRAQEERNKMMVKLQEQTEKIISSMDLVKKDELEAVKLKVEELEKQIKAFTDEKEA